MANQTECNLTDCKEISDIFQLLIYETGDVFHVLHITQFEGITYLYLLLSISFTLLIIYLQFWPINWNHELCDVGYDFLWEGKSLWTSRESKKRMVQEITKLRKVGELPPIYPNGWIALLESSDLRNGQVKHVAALGENFAVFRSEKGEVMILDAYCPHLGANMAVGGIVKGNCLECPYHGWAFDGVTGQCVDIPYSDKVISGAKVKKWISCERNDFIHVWYHAENSIPYWEVEEIPQVKSGGWWYRGRNEFIVKCHCQELSENGGDSAHMKAIHSQSMFTGSKAGCFNRPQMNLFEHEWSADWKPNSNEHVADFTVNQCLKIFGKFPVMSLVAEGKQIGPTHSEILLDSAVGPILMTLNWTPLGPLLQRLIHRFYCPPRCMIYAYIFMIGENIMVKRDIWMWNHKLFRKRALVAKEESMLINHRKWYRQFYSEHSPAFSFRRDGMDW